MKMHPDVTPLEMNGQFIARCNNAKLLGVILTSDLKWDTHVGDMCKKANQRLYQLIVLKRCKVPPEQLVSVYKSQVRSVLEYAAPVWHPSLTKELSSLIESVQKRALHIIYPELNYEVVLSKLNLPSLNERRVTLCKRLFCDIQKTDHKLHSLLPSKRDQHYSIRGAKPYPLPKLRTKRSRGSFINWALFNLQS